MIAWLLYDLQGYLKISRDKEFSQETKPTIILLIFESINSPEIRSLFLRILTKRIIVNDLNKYQQRRPGRVTRLGTTGRGDLRLRVSFEDQPVKTTRELNPEKPQAEGLRIIR
jgi:hypothetical protein